MNLGQCLALYKYWYVILIELIISYFVPLPETFRMLTKYFLILLCFFCRVAFNIVWYLMLIITSIQFHELYKEIN